MKRIDPDDPKWTAYILGELDDAARAAVESELNSSEEARTLVEELRFAANLTKSEFARAITPQPLTQQQRKAILSAAGVFTRRRWFERPRMAWATGLAAASLAAIVLTFTVWHMWWRPQMESATPMSVVAEMRRSEPSKPDQQDQPKDAPKPAATPALRQKRASNLAPATAAGASPPALERDLNALDNFTADAKAEKKQDAVSLPQAAAEEAQTRPAPAPPASPAAVAGVAGGVAGGAYRLAEPQAQKTEQDLADHVRAQQSQATVNGQASANSPLVQAPPPAPRALVGATALDRAKLVLRKSASTSNSSADNPFLDVAQSPISTFSVDVDSASYSTLRDYLNRGTLPPRDAVRVEEMINFFTYSNPQASGTNPIAASIEAASAPWNPQHRLVRIGIKAVSAVRNTSVQVSFNPLMIVSYRLVGYENGSLTDGNLKDVAAVSASLTANRTVTALYEVVPSAQNPSSQTLTVNIGYVAAINNERRILSFPFFDRGQTFASSTGDFRFTAAVASFGLILRNSPYKGTATFDTVLSIAENSLGPDPGGLRRNFLQLVRQARQIRR